MELIAATLYQARRWLLTRAGRFHRARNGREREMQVRFWNDPTGEIP